MTAPELDLDGIRARADAASPGPWHIEHEHDDRENVPPSQWPYAIAGPVNVSCRAPHISQSYREQYGHTVSEISDLDESDADFIAHARQDVPALIAEVDRLRDENTDHALRAQLEQKRNHYARLAGTAADPDVREWLTAFVSTLTELLTTRAATGPESTTVEEWAVAVTTEARVHIDRFPTTHPAAIVAADDLTQRLAPGHTSTAGGFYNGERFLSAAVVHRTRTVTATPDVVTPWEPVDTEDGDDR